MQGDPVARTASLTLSAGGGLLRLTPIRRQDSDSPAPGDVLPISVTVHSAPFIGAFVTEAWGAELRSLRDLLADLHAAGPAGTASRRHAFALRAGTVRLGLVLDPEGALTVEAEVCADPGGPTVLRMAIGAGHSDLPRWLDELDALLDVFPPRLEPAPELVPG